MLYFTSSFYKSAVRGLRFVLLSGISVGFLTASEAATTPTSNNSNLQIATTAYVNATLLNNALLKTALGQAGGVASLDGTGRLPVSQLPVGILTSASDLSQFNVFHNGMNKTLDAWLTYVQANGSGGTGSGGFGAGTDISQGVVIPSGQTVPVSDAIIAGLAENAIPKVGGDISATLATATGSTTARKTADWLSDVVNVMAFNAKGDDSTDDAAAINAAVAYARTKIQSNGWVTAQLVFPAGHRFRIGSPINLTGLTSANFVVEMNGASVDCQVAGGVCIDAIGSTDLRWYGVSVTGSSTAVPKIGVQFGRIGQNDNAGGHVFDHLSVTGQFQLAAVYDHAAESVTWIHPKITNVGGSAGSYTLIMDAFNHVFSYTQNGAAATTSLSSTFQNITAATDVVSPFAANSLINPDIEAGVGQTVPLWLGGSTRLSISGGYGVGGGSSCGPTCYGAVLFGEQTVANTALHIDMHFAGTGLTDAFLVSGDASQTVAGFHYSDVGLIASNSLLKTDTSITAVALTDANLSVQTYLSGAKLLDAPTKWKINGGYHSSSLTGFNATAGFVGPVSIGGATTSVIYNGSAVQEQIADGTAVGGNARGVSAVDLQSVRSLATAVASGNYSVVSGGINNTAGGQYGAIGGGVNNTTSGSADFAAGNNTTLTGDNSVGFGKGATDFGNAGSLVFSGGFNTVPGDEGVFGLHHFFGTGSGTTPIRMTVGGAAVGAHNCLNINDNQYLSLDIVLIATDTTTAGNGLAWRMPVALLSRDVGIGSVAVVGGSFATAPKGTGSNATVTVVGDTTFSCLNLSFVPPSNNTTDVWRVSATIQATGVQ